MSGYRCYFLDDGGKFKDVHEFACADDASAVLIAMRLLASRPQFGDIELWDGARAVTATRGMSR